MLRISNEFLSDLRNCFKEEQLIEQADLLQVCVGVGRRVILKIPFKIADFFGFLLVFIFERIASPIFCSLSSSTCFVSILFFSVQICFDAKVSMPQTAVGTA